ncbi:DUF6332 family protein [Actinacidiphila sp. bgisy144]|uniref:DUF6332 family protein n=1 Tax=unclassified Actinacidiphila TaxID=2995708 RepID=UPI003EB6E492
MRTGRKPTERGATTREMVRAVVAGALLAVAGFTAVMSPVLAKAAHGRARQEYVTGAVIGATALFCGRLAFTLRRVEWRDRMDGWNPGEPRSAVVPDGESTMKSDGSLTPRGCTESSSATDRAADKPGSFPLDA